MATFKPFLPYGSMVIVPVRGGGPGLNLDFATFSFQVPIMGSCGSCCAQRLAETASIASVRITLLRIPFPPFVGSPVWSMDYLVVSTSGGWDAS